MTKRQAEAKLRELLADAQRGVLPLQNVSGATFGDACAEWLRYVEFDRERTRSTVSDYKSVVERALLPRFGSETPIEQVTMRTIDAYRADLSAEGRLSNRTINKHLVILHGIFKRAQRVWELPSNPASAVERQPVRNTGKFAVLAPEEVEALARAATSEQDAALFKTAAFTGLRLGELRALEWDDVDFDKRLIHVRQGFTRWELGDTKSHKVRSVPMIDQVMEVLDRLSERPMWVGRQHLVFPSVTGFYFDDSRLRRRFKKALADAELEPIRFHDLRHTFGTIAVQAFPLSDVKAFMGHADIQTTMIYVHHVPQHDAAERLTRVITSSRGFEES
ncbi:MAG: tyrosine-type recombinase/integrase [Solirubrobacterales bacterium]